MIRQKLKQRWTLWVRGIRRPEARAVRSDVQAEATPELLESLGLPEIVAYQARVKAEVCAPSRAAVSLHQGQLELQSAEALQEYLDKMERFSIETLKRSFAEERAKLTRTMSDRFERERRELGQRLDRRLAHESFEASKRLEKAIGFEQEMAKKRTNLLLIKENSEMAARQAARERIEAEEAVARLQSAQERELLLSNERREEQRRAEEAAADARAATAFQREELVLDRRRAHAGERRVLAEATARAQAHRARLSAPSFAPPAARPAKPAASPGPTLPLPVTMKADGKAMKRHVGPDRAPADKLPLAAEDEHVEQSYREYEDAVTAFRFGENHFRARLLKLLPKDGAAYLACEHLATSEKSKT